MKGKQKGASNGKDQITLRMDKAHFKALEILIPGFGSTVSEVARYIVMDWMKTNLGLDRMKELGLVR
jgi:predicted DNA-binding helix-hairpin-helix protein